MGAKVKKYDSISIQGDKNSENNTTPNAHLPWLSVASFGK